MLGSLPHAREAADASATNRSRTSLEYLPEQPSDALADPGAALDRADADVFRGSDGAFAYRHAGVDRMQRDETADALGRAPRQIAGPVRGTRPDSPSAATDLAGRSPFGLFLLSGVTGFPILRGAGLGPAVCGDREGERSVADRQFHKGYDADRG
jgi:hypothetical protein